MIIKSIAETSYKGMYKVLPVEGASFFIRPDYLLKIPFESIDSGSDFNDEQTCELLDAAMCCVIEIKAVAYLARCEQSHFGLAQKLHQKKFEKIFIEKVLCFLEKANYLSDERFAKAWLHSRALNHFEGKTKLINELISRGISKEISTECVNEFFTENDESQICLKAAEKLIKKGKTDDKLIASLMNSGFTYKLIKRVISDNNLS